MYCPNLGGCARYDMRDELGSRFAHRTLAEQDHPLQTRFLDRPHKPFSLGIRISLQMRRMATLKVDVSE